MKTVMRTTIVVDCTSARDGEITLRISARTSLRNSARRAGCDFNCWIPVLGCSVTAIVLAIVLPLNLRVRVNSRTLRAGQTGGGARIRTEKFGFGDRQFN